MPVSANTANSIVGMLVAGVISVVFSGLMLFLLRTWLKDVKDLLSNRCH